MQFNSCRFGDDVPFLGKYMSILDLMLLRLFLVCLDLGWLFTLFYFVIYKAVFLLAHSVPYSTTIVFFYR